jgi:hypothetical protein
MEDRQGRRKVESGVSARRQGTPLAWDFRTQSRQRPKLHLVAWVLEGVR